VHVIVILYMSHCGTTQYEAVSTPAAGRHHHHVTNTPWHPMLVALIAIIKLTITSHCTPHHCKPLLAAVAPLRTL
jgi:hypothetical protein